MKLLPAANYQNRHRPRRERLALLLLAMLLTSLALITVTTTRPYTSDDVAQQDAVASLSLRSQPILDLPQNNYIIKLPLYAVLGALPLPPQTSLLVTTLALNLAGFLLFYLAAQSFVRMYAPAQVSTLIPFVWLASLGVGLASVLINPNTRNLEIGLAFTALALLARWHKGDWRIAGRRGYMVGALFVVLLGLFFYNDPFFVYTLAAPIVLILGAKWLAFGRDRRALILSLGMLAAVVVSKLWYGLFWLIGVHAGQGTAVFASMPTIARNTQLFVSGALELFNANIFGRTVIGIHSVALELNFLILMATLLSPLLLLWRAVRQDIWKTFLILQPPFIAIAFITGTMVVDSESVRYLVLLPFYAALIGVLVMAKTLAPRVRYLIVMVLTLVTTLNVASTIQIYLDQGDNPNAANLEIAKVAKANHLTKGYASYWNAGINQYFADNEVLFIQSGCSRTSGVRPYRTLLNEQVLQRRASSSFYLFDPAATRCNEADLARYFGEPQRAIDLEGARRLLVYDYDITRRMYER